MGNLDTSMSCGPDGQVCVNDIPIDNYYAAKKQTTKRSVPVRLRDYVASMKKRKTPLSQVLDKMDPEHKKYQRFEDCITWRYVDIPVTLNEELYDWSTLEKLERDPHTRRPFTLENVQTGYKIVKEIEALMKPNQKT